MEKALHYTEITYVNTQIAHRRRNIPDFVSVEAVFCYFTGCLPQLFWVHVLARNLLREQHLAQGAVPPVLASGYVSAPDKKLLAWGDRRFYKRKEKPPPPQKSPPGHEPTRT